MLGGGSFQITVATPTPSTSRPPTPASQPERPGSATPGRAIPTPPAYAPALIQIAEGPEGQAPNPGTDDETGKEYNLAGGGPVGPRRRLPVSQLQRQDRPPAGL